MSGTDPHNRRFTPPPPRSQQQYPDPSLTNESNNTHQSNNRRFTPPPPRGQQQYPDANHNFVNDPHMSCPPPPHSN